MNSLNELKKDIKHQIVSDLQDGRNLEDEELYSKIDDLLYLRKDLSLKNKLYLRSAVFNSFRRLDVLSELLDAPEITEIMINSHKEIFIERSGHQEKWNRCFESRDQLEEVIQTIVSKVNRSVNTSNPIVDARLEDGSRVHVVLPPISLKGPTLTTENSPNP